MEDSGCEIKLENILNEKQLHQILAKTAKPGAQITGYELKPATSGLIGFLGDHLKLTLQVKEDYDREIHLFIKKMPKLNKPKVEYIKQNFYYEREALIYKIFEEMEDSNDDKPWRPKALIYSDNILVMPDLCIEGYKSHPLDKLFDKDHVVTTLTTVAHFHAASLKYTTMRTKKDGNYNFLYENGHIITEPLFSRGPWLDTAAKLTSNFLKELSEHSKEYPKDLEKRIVDVYTIACESLKEYKDTVNVTIHKDLWPNNIFFKYSGDKVTNALLLDFQCLRFAPPAFDIMQFLFLNTSRKFRESHEREVLQHYYTIFIKSLDNDSKGVLQSYNYDLNTFLSWCERARLFGMMEAATILPFVLMGPEQAQKNFDDPETFMSLLFEDRSVPIIQHAREHKDYKNRQLEICEELVEKYIR